MQHVKNPILFSICLLLVVNLLIVGMNYSHDHGFEHTKYHQYARSNTSLPLIYPDHDQSYLRNPKPFKSPTSTFLGDDTFHLTRCGHGNKEEVDVLCMEKKICYLFTLYVYHCVLTTPGIADQASDGNSHVTRCKKPPSFLRNYKNPCWMNNGTLRCYPYFQLIGMDKSGSSDLFSRLAKHPDIYGNTGTLGKETQWWPSSKYGNIMKGAACGAGNAYPSGAHDFTFAFYEGIFMMHNIAKESFNDYLEYFTNATNSIEAKVDQFGYHVGITGDGTPMDAWDFSGWPQIPQNTGLKEPMFTTPDLIKHIYPNVKLIMIMRNPIDRLYSDYFFIGLGGTTPQDFHNSVVKSIGYLTDCMANRSLRVCLYDRQMHLKWNVEARIHLGFYYVFVSEWLAVFPRQQFLFLKTEEYSNKINETIEGTFDFLEVRPLSPAEYNTYGINYKERKHTTKRKPLEPMLNETRQILHDLYQPFNYKLADLLNDAAFTWDDS